MPIQRSSDYDSMSWVDALLKRKQPIRDKEAHLLSQIGKGEQVDGALDKACEAAFGTPSKEISSEEAIHMASRDIQDQRATDARTALVNDVKVKLSNHGVDPVALGVVSKDDWDKCNDHEAAERVAKQAVERQIKAKRESWQADAMTPNNRSMLFDPARSRGGQVSSTAAAMEDSAQVFSRQMPSNAASIFDPFRLDRMASEEENAHDKSIQDSRKASMDRRNAHNNWRTKDHEIPEDFQPMCSGAIQKSGGCDSLVPSGKVPSNQVSMLDDVSASSPKEAKEKMAQLFESKVEDNLAKIREANKARKESISRGPKDDKSWDKVSKPLSTKELHDKLIDLWMPEKPSK